MGREALGGSHGEIQRRALVGKSQKLFCESEMALLSNRRRQRRSVAENSLTQPASLETE
jgi:hypothetical protein